MLTLGKQVDAFLIQLEMILMLFLRAQMACKVDTWPLNTVVVTAHSQASITVCIFTVRLRPLH